MKKIFILLLSVVALLAFTASAFALHGVEDMLDYTPSVVKAKNAQIVIFGHFRIRGNVDDNTSDFQDTVDNTGAFKDDGSGYDQRVRLGVAATVSPNTMGTIELETAAGGGDGFTWGAIQGGAGVYAASGNAKPTDMHLRQAYIAHQGTGLLGQLSGFKAGHMLIALGNGSFYNHTKSGDDGLIFWTQPMDGTEIAFAILKGDENGGASDIDVYAVTFETAMNGIGLSGDLGYLNDHASTLGATDEGITLWNLGLRASTDVSGFKLNGGCDIQSGEVEAFKTDRTDMDLSGYQCQIGASTNIADVSVHAKFAYGSGDDIGSADDYEGFITSISSGGNVGTFVYDNAAITAAQKGFSSSAATSSTYTTGNATSTNGLANTWYLNIGATASLNPDTKINGELFYLQASESVNMNSATTSDEKDIGFEVDGKITYQLDTAVAYYVEAGILIAGDFYKNITGGLDPDNAWKLRHGIVLNF
jgi:hypothetical protein